MKRLSNIAIRSTRMRKMARIVAIGTLSVAGLWLAIHHIPGVGPALADGARAVVGPAPVAWAEDVVYGVEDRVNRLLYSNAPPKTFWQGPSPPHQETPTRTIADRSPSMHAGFAPPPFIPPFEEVASEGDGEWIAVESETANSTPPVLWKSIVHPDPRRTFAAVAIVAIDLHHVALRLVAGTKEPFSKTVRADHRSGLVDPNDLEHLVAAFNGGFKAMHGHYGMMLHDDTFLPPRNIACTIALYDDGSVRIRTWRAIKNTKSSMIAFRQTPPCLVETGTPHRALDAESNQDWGATVSGDTIIRRSALGIDSAGRLLFYGLGEAVTAQAIARAMQAAGASDVAQLDVNHAFPRFLFYRNDSADQVPRADSCIIPDVSFKPDEYVKDPSPRDFFYLIRTGRRKEG